MTRSFVDALGRTLVVPWPPLRVVSLVASQTETLVRLGLGERLVGRTRYCVEPRGLVESIATVGGEKSPHVEDILSLAPDLVVANKEENRKADVERLEAAGVAVYVTYPRTVIDGIATIRELAAVTGCDSAVGPLVAACEAELSRPAPAAPPRVLAFIWKKPWMVLGGDSFANDMIVTAGAVNCAAGLDGRYPRVDLAEAMALAPDMVLLPDEPYAFGEADFADFDALPAPPGARRPRLALLDGKQLTWFGPRIGDSLRSLRLLFEAGMRAGPGES